MITVHNINSTTAARTVPLPAPDLPAGWRLVRFGDVVRSVDVVIRDPQAAGIERVVGLDHLDPESLHIKRWNPIDDGTSFTRKFTTGQVLFGKRRAYQRKVAVAEFDGICSGDILVFEPEGDALIPELLPFIVQSDGFFNHALGTSAGSLSPRTRWRDLAEYKERPTAEQSVAGSPHDYAIMRLASHLLRSGVGLAATQPAPAVGERRFSSPTTPRQVSVSRSRLITRAKPERIR